MVKINYKSMITIIVCTNRKDAVSMSVAQQYQEILEAEGAECRILSLRELPQDFIYSALYENAGKNEQFKSCE